ncbi:MAG TPA: SDR family NAD(P)-dependent oxidoreductase [Anaerolineaceae bacterium]
MNATSSKALFKDRFGPWALVAGASHGMGAEYADQLAARGLNLVLVARNAGELDALAASLKAAHAVQVLPLVADLSDPSTPAEIIAKTDGLEIGLLVYNAAFSAIGTFLEIGIEEHNREIETNIRAPLTLAHHFGKPMVERGHGGLVLMSSLSSVVGSAYIASYTATKAFNMILAEGIWEELRQHGVQVLASCPGATRTPGYLRSLKNGRKGPGISEMEPRDVVAETLAALSRQQPSVVPGTGNRFAAFFMRRVMPRSAAIRMMGSVMRGMYAKNP